MADRGLTVDLNADAGEREDAIDEDRAILAAVTSVSVACGGHAGTGETMRAVCEAAVERDVRIGAHVSYVDREEFGRHDREVAPEVLREQIVEQIARLVAAAADSGGTVRYVKPHGALYHRCARDPAQAAAVAAAIASVSPGVYVVVPPGSALGGVAQAVGLERVIEGYADRGYARDGSLLPRGEPGAILTPAAAAVQAGQIVRSGLVSPAAGGEPIPLTAQTLCLHSDTPGAAELARVVRAALDAAGVAVRPFA